MATRRRADRVPVGLQLRKHEYTGSEYWAVIAVQTMSKGRVGILQPYDESWQRPRKGTIAITFIDEVKQSSTELDNVTVYIKRGWLEKFFLEPTWQEFEQSDCRVIGATAGIMTGLLPAEGVPVKIGSGKSAPKTRQATETMLRGTLPIVLINIVVLAAIWLLSKYVERQREANAQ